MTVGLRCIESRQRHAWNQGRVVKTEQKGEGTRGGGGWGWFYPHRVGPYVGRRWATITKSWSRGFVGQTWVGGVGWGSSLGALDLGVAAALLLASQGRASFLCVCSGSELVS